MRAWVLLAVAIVLEVPGSLSLKAAIDMPAFSGLVTVAYLGAFLALFGALREGMPLGVGYGIWGACGVALTAVMSMALFAEPITPMMGLGITVVMAGVLLVELGAHAAAPERETIS